MVERPLGSTPDVLSLAHGGLQHLVGNWVVSLELGSSRTDER